MTATADQLVKVINGKGGGRDMSGTSLLRAGPAVFSTDHLHPVQSAFEVRGTPLKPKPGLNGALVICYP